MTSLLAFACALRDSLYIIPLSFHFVNTFFKLFLSFLMICETLTTRKFGQSIPEVQFAQWLLRNTPSERFEGCILLWKLIFEILYYILSRECEFLSYFKNFGFYNFQPLKPLIVGQECPTYYSCVHTIINLVRINAPYMLTPNLRIFNR